MSEAFAPKSPTPFHMDPLEATYRSVLTGMRICQLYAFMLLLFLLIIPVQAAIGLIFYGIQWVAAAAQNNPAPALPELAELPDRTWVEFLFITNVWIVFHIYSRLIRFWPAVLMCFVGLAHNVYVSNSDFFEGKPLSPITFNGYTLNTEQQVAQFLTFLIWLVGHLYFFYVAIRGQYSIHALPKELRRRISEQPDNRLRPFKSLAEFANIPTAIRYARRKIYTATLMIISGVSNFVNYWLVSAIVIGLAVLPVFGTMLYLGLQSAFQAYRNTGSLTTVSMTLGFMLAITLGIILVLAVGPIWAHYLGRFGTRIARAQMRRSLEQVQGADTRSPILFLRSFSDDQVRIPPRSTTRCGHFEQWLLDGSSRSVSLDHLLLQEGTVHGPTVALGKPDDPAPPYGVSRGYFEHSDWQAAVTRLCEDAQAIVLVIDQSEGLAWEIEFVLSQGHVGKTLFLLRPDDVGTSAGIEMMTAILERTGASVVLDERAAQPSVMAAWPAPDGGQQLVVTSSTSAYAYLLTLRSFLRSARADSKS
jgi:hypothetical protein